MCKYIAQITYFPCILPYELLFQLNTRNTKKKKKKIISNGSFSQCSDFHVLNNKNILKKKKNADLSSVKDILKDIHK